MGSPHFVRLFASDSSGSETPVSPLPESPHTLLKRIAASAIVVLMATCFIAAFTFYGVISISLGRIFLFITFILGAGGVVFSEWLWRKDVSIKVFVGFIVVIIWGGALIWVDRWAREHGTLSESAHATATSPVVAAERPKTNVPRYVETRNPTTNSPCLQDFKGHFYSDYSHLPGGPDLKRPLIVINTGEVPAAHSDLPDGTMYLFFKLVLTNRGETSIVKNWTLCMVEDGHAAIYNVVQIPKNIPPIVGTTEMITPEKSLVDNVIKNPIEHAHTAGGWVAFLLPKEAADRWRNGKPLKSAFRFKDYLDHEYAFEFDYDPTAKRSMNDYYEPGAPN